MHLFNLEPSDSHQLAQCLQEADVLVSACSHGDLLCGTMQDLQVLQGVIDRITPQALKPQQLKAISGALGRVLLHEQSGSDWGVVQGAHQRGFAIRRVGTLHWISPEGALRSHLHGQAAPNLQHLFASMLERLNPPALAA